MKGYLYKLKEGYVLCSDEEIKEGDTILHQSHGVCNIHKAREIVGKSIVIGQNKESSCWIDYSKKVLTQSSDFSLMSEEDAKRIGWFDVEKWADNEATQRYKIKTSPIETYREMIHQRLGFYEGLQAGFQKALELTEDRRFTEDDMREAMLLLSRRLLTRDKTSAQKVEEIIESFYTPKSWEVEYKEENEVYKILSII